MKLKQLSLNNFRCLENTKLSFDPTFNLIYGKNGQGKTSLIEAVYFLATGKSFRTKKVKDITSYDRIRTIVYGNFDANNISKAIAIDYNNDKKEYYIDKNKTKYIDYVGVLNVISFISSKVILSRLSINESYFNLNSDLLSNNFR